MKTLVASAVTLSVAFGGVAMAQDAGTTQLTPRIGTQISEGTTSVLDPVTGFLTTTTVTATSVTTITIVAATGLLIAASVEAIATDDDDDGNAGTTGATGS